jgi:HK97 family phage major capsid protein
MKPATRDTRPGAEHDGAMNLLHDFQPDDPIPRDTLAQIGRALERHYPELHGITGKPAQRFSMVRYLRALANRTGLGFEGEVLEATAAVQGKQFDPNRAFVPWSVFGRDVRTLSATPGSSGGYLASAQTLSPVDVLRPWSVVASAGMQEMSGLSSNPLIPTGDNANGAAWVGETEGPESDADPTLGSVSMTPRIGMGQVKVPMQLLRQGEAVEPFVRASVQRKAGELIDAAVLAGAGGKAPLGLVNAPGVGAQSGSSLAHAGILTMRKQVLAAGAQEANLTWIGAPAVQELLGARERAAGGSRFVWDTDGVLGRPAHATRTAPATTLIVGDFSQAVLGIWGPGIRIDVDPSQLFDSAGMVVRVLLFVDVAFPQPGAFSVATSIS